MFPALLVLPTIKTKQNPDKLTQTHTQEQTVEVRPRDRISQAPRASLRTKGSGAKHTQEMQHAFPSRRFRTFPREVLGHRRNSPEAGQRLLLARPPLPRLRARRAGLLGDVVHVKAVPAGSPCEADCYHRLHL